MGVGLEGRTATERFDDAKIYIILHKFYCFFLFFHLLQATEHTNGVLRRMNLSELVFVCSRLTFKLQTRRRRHEFSKIVYLG